MPLRMYYRSSISRDCHMNFKNSPGLGPGRVRSPAGLVNFLVLVLVIGIGEGLPSPLTPLPWATWAENCLPDPSSEVAVCFCFDILKSPIKSTEMHA